MDDLGLAAHGDLVSFPAQAVEDEPRDLRVIFDNEKTHRSIENGSAGMVKRFWNWSSLARTTRKIN